MSVKRSPNHDITSLDVSHVYPHTQKESKRTRSSNNLGPNTVLSQNQVPAEVTIQKIKIQVNPKEQKRKIKSNKPIYDIKGLIKIQE